MTEQQQLILETLRSNPGYHIAASRTKKHFVYNTTGNPVLEITAEDRKALVESGDIKPNPRDRGYSWYLPDDPEYIEECETYRRDQENARLQREMEMED